MAKEKKSLLSRFLKSFRRKKTTRTKAIEKQAGQSLTKEQIARFHGQTEKSEQPQPPKKEAAAAPEVSTQKAVSIAEQIIAMKRKREKRKTMLTGKK